MASAIRIAVALLIAVFLAWWAYGRREEPVPGRWPPALLRGSALFLLLIGLLLPPLRHTDAPGKVRSLVLLDASRSMSLPVVAGSSVTRWESALALLTGAGAAQAPGARGAPGPAAPPVLRSGHTRVLLFGETPLPLTLDSARRLRPSAGRSRLAPALQAARLAGADTVWVLTDGEWDDRDEAVHTARGLGLAVRERRIGQRVARVGVRDVVAPERIPAGDTVRVEVELVAGGSPGGGEARTPGMDSVRVELRRDGEVVARVTVERPAPGRFVRAQIRFLPRPPAPAGGPSASEWRRYQVALSPPDPFGATDRRDVWMEVTRQATGAVVISTSPDWELRFLLPALRRTVLGGARGFLRVGPDRYLEMGEGVGRTADSVEVARAARAAGLLVLQGDFGRMDSWLARVAAAHGRRLLFPGTPGPVPGTSVVAGQALDGEWYPVAPVPAGPAARLLSGLSFEELPPLDRVYGLRGQSRWTLLFGQRARRGEARPLLVAGQRGRRRWVVAPGSGYWRWAFREGTPRRVYEGLVGGLVGWLMEDFSPRPVALAEIPEPGEPVRWRVAAGVRDLRLAVLDSVSDTLWSGRWETPASEVRGPVASRELVTLVARGRSPEGPFTLERPLLARLDPREELPRPVPSPLALPGSARPGSKRSSRGPRPVWPFAVSALLLCGEWAWRRRIGLR